MKNLKKIAAGLFVLLFAALFWLIFPQKSLAVSVDNDGFLEPAATYTVESVVDGEPETVSAVIGGETYLFVDRDPTDDTHNLKYYGDGLICNMDPKISGVKNSKEGINHTGNSQSLANGTSTGWPATITLSYSGDTDKDCSEGAAQKFLPETNITFYSNSPETNVGSTDQGQLAGADDKTLAQLLAEGGSGDPSACAANSNTTLEWILCPIINAISKFTDQMNNFVEGQLHFRVGQLLPNDGQVNKAWTIIKNIVAGLVVILMLVMVISQAVGGQFFDAYTVKKMLPRLVIAVIAMQFSWVIGKWMIGIANDLGEGLKQIMLAPFGGGGNMDLPSIMHHLNGAYPAITGGAAVFGVFLLLIIAFKDFILPALIFIAVAVGSALLIALATLVFRNILIVMAVIFAPLALLLWATPGQTMQGYWKKYADNFAKLLLFFPLVIALIYTGRIAAWLAGGFGAPSLIEYLIVLVAFFGPYFFLPKTFKWGGQLLGAINQGINQNKLVNMGKQWGFGLAKDHLADARGNRARKYTDSEQKGARFNTYSLFGRGISKVPGVRRAFMDKNGLGRRLPFNETQRNMLGSGMLFQSQINRRKAARLGKEYKDSVDAANEELAKRKAETARKPGQMAGWTVQRGANGEMLFKAFSRDKTKRPGWSAAFAAARRDLFSGDTRRADRAAQWFQTHPEFGIHSNNLIPLDVNNKMWKDLKAFERAEGLSGTPYNANDLSKKDGDLHTELAGLANKHRNGQLTDPAEVSRFKQLNYLMNLRAGEHKPFDKAEIKRMKEDLKFIQDTDPNGAYYNDDVTGGKDEGGLAYVRMAQLLPTQLKATSLPEVQQAMANMYYENMPNVMARLQENEGWQLMENDFDEVVAKARVAVANPRSKEAAYFKQKGIDPGDIDKMVSTGLFYNATDMHRYAGTDHSSYGRWANQNESTLDQKAADDGRALDKLQWGYQEKDNLGGDTLLPGLSDFTTMTEGIIERQDPTLTQIMTNLSQTPSTRDNFQKWLGQAVPTTRHIAAMWEDIKKPGHEQFKGQAVNNIRKILKKGYDLGIPTSNGRPNYDRDIKILELLPTFRHYYPQMTAEGARFVYDQAIDRDGALREQQDLAAHPEWQVPDLPPDLIAEHPDLQRYVYATPQQEAISNEAQSMIRRIQTGNIPLSEITVRNEELKARALAEIPTAPIAPPAPTPTRETPRWQMAQQVLNSMTPGRPLLNRVQQTAVQRAHEIGSGEVGRDGNAARVGNYTREQLRRKAETLSNAGFIPAERRLLMEEGIVGEAAAPAEPAPAPAEPTEIRIDHSAASAALAAVRATAPAPAPMPLPMPAAAPVNIAPAPILPPQNFTKVIQVIKEPGVITPRAAPVKATPQNEMKIPHDQGQSSDRPGSEATRKLWQDQADANLIYGIKKALEPFAQASEAQGKKVDTGEIARRIVRNQGNNPRR